MSLYLKKGLSLMVSMVLLVSSTQFAVFWDWEVDSVTESVTESIVEVVTPVSVQEAVVEKAPVEVVSPDPIPVEVVTTPVATSVPETSLTEEQLVNVETEIETNNIELQELATDDNSIEVEVLQETQLSEIVSEAETQSDTVQSDTDTFSDSQSDVISDEPIALEVESTSDDVSTIENLETNNDLMQVIDNVQEFIVNDVLDISNEDDIDDANESNSDEESVADILEDDSQVDSESQNTNSEEAEVESTIVNDIELSSENISEDIDSQWGLTGQLVETWSELATLENSDQWIEGGIGTDQESIVDSVIWATDTDIVNVTWPVNQAEELDQDRKNELRNELRKQYNNKRKIDWKLTSKKFRKKTAKSKKPKNNLRNKKRYNEWEVLVKFKKNKIDLKKRTWRSKFDWFVKSRWMKEKKRKERSNISLLKSEKSKTTEQLIRDLKNNDEVEFVQPNYLYEPRGVWSQYFPNDTDFAKLWALHNVWQEVEWISWKDDADIDWPEAMHLVKQNTVINPVVVAVIDTWINYNNPEFEGMLWNWENCKDENWDFLWWCIYWYDYYTEDNDPIELYHSHWTHIAWTIGAKTNNGIWMSWVWNNVKIMTLKAWGSHFSTFAAVRSIEFAASNWAKIINASWWYYWLLEYGDVDLYLYNAMKNFQDSWWLFVTAAWNDSVDNDYYEDYPSSFATDFTYWGIAYPWLDNIIWVTATDQNDELASSANYWYDTVHIGAPWTSIYSTISPNDSGIIYNEDFEWLWTSEIPEWYTVTTEDNYWGGSAFYVLYWDQDNYLPYTANVNSVIESNVIDLSTYQNAKISFVAGCDTEYLYEWNDYMTFWLKNSSSSVELARWSEITLDSLNWDSIYDTDFEYYDFDFDIDPEFLTSDFQFTFSWNTNGDDNNYDWCWVDNIKIIEDLDVDLWFKYWTSFAAPHVAWVAALAWEMEKDASYADIKNAILEWWDSLDSLDWKVRTWKRLNAYGTLIEIAKLGDETPNEDETNYICDWTNTWPFDDVSESVWYNDYINVLANNWVFTSEDSNIYPWDSVNRADLLTAVFRAANLQLGSEDDAGFSDVSESDCFYEYVNLASNLAMINWPINDFLFNPSENITIAEAAKMLLSGFGINYLDYQHWDVPDANIEWHWWEAYIKALYELSVFEASFISDPDRNLTRAEFSKILSLMIIVSDDPSTYVRFEDWTAAFEPFTNNDVVYMVNAILDYDKDSQLALLAMSLSAWKDVIIGTENNVAHDFLIENNDNWDYILNSFKVAEQWDQWWFNENTVVSVKLWKKTWTNEQHVATVNLASNSIEFTNLNLLIPRRESVRLILTVDISENFEAWSSFNLKAFDFNIQNLSGMVIGIDQNFINSTRQINIIQGWVLEVRVDNDDDVINNQDKNILAYSTSDFVWSFEFKAFHESVTIEDLSIQTFINWELSDLSDNIENISIYADDKITLIWQEIVSDENTEFSEIDIFQWTSNIYIKIMTHGIWEDLKWFETSQWFSFWINVGNSVWEMSLMGATIEHIPWTTPANNIVATQISNVSFSTWWQEDIKNWLNTLAILNVSALTNDNTSDDWSPLNVVLEDIKFDIGLYNMTKDNIDSISITRYWASSYDLVASGIVSWSWDDLTFEFPWLNTVINNDSLVEWWDTALYYLEAELNSLQSDSSILIWMNNLNGGNITYKSCTDYTCMKKAENAQEISSLNLNSGLSARNPVVLVSWEEWWEVFDSQISLNTITLYSDKDVLIGSFNNTAHDFMIENNNKTNYTLNSFKVSEQWNQWGFNQDSVVSVKLLKIDWSTQELISTKTLNEDDVVEFNDLDITITWWFETRLILMVDIWDQRSENWNSFKLKAYDFNITHPITGNVANLDPSYVISDRQINIIWAWVLEVKVDNDDDVINNQDRNILAYTTSDFVWSFEFKAFHESIIIEDLSIQTFIDWIPVGFTNNIENINIYADDKVTLLQQAIVDDEIIEFDNINYEVEWKKNIYLTVDTYGIWEDMKWFETSAWFTFWINVINAEWQITWNDPAILTLFWWTTPVNNIVATKINDVSFSIWWQTDIRNWLNSLAILNVSALSNDNISDDWDPLNVVLQNIDFDVSLNNITSDNIISISLERIWWDINKTISGVLLWEWENAIFDFPWFVGYLKENIVIEWGDTALYMLSAEFDSLASNSSISIWMNNLNDGNISYASCSDYTCIKRASNSQVISSLNLDSGPSIVNPVVLVSWEKWWEVVVDEPETGDIKWELKVTATNNKWWEVSSYHFEIDMKEDFPTTAYSPIIIEFPHSFNINNVSIKDGSLFHDDLNWQWEIEWEAWYWEVVIAQTWWLSILNDWQNWERIYLLIESKEEWEYLSIKKWDKIQFELDWIQNPITKWDNYSVSTTFITYENSLSNARWWWGNPTYDIYSDLIPVRSNISEIRNASDNIWIHWTVSDKAYEYNPELFSYEPAKHDYKFYYSKDESSIENWCDMTQWCSILTLWQDLTSYQATISWLEENSKYFYKIQSDITQNEIYSFHTPKVVDIEHIDSQLVSSVPVFFGNLWKITLEWEEWWSLLFESEDQFVDIKIPVWTTIEWDASWDWSFNPPTHTINPDTTDLQESLNIEWLTINNVIWTISMWSDQSSISFSEPVPVTLDFDIDNIEWNEYFAYYSHDEWVTWESYNPTVSCIATASWACTLDIPHLSDITIVEQEQEVIKVDTTSTTTSWWGGGGWWGWWGWWSTTPSISTYTLPAWAKRDINTIDNINLKNIWNWLIPVDITMNHISKKYFVTIPMWTSIVYWDSSYTWTIKAPKKILNKNAPKIKWYSPYRVIEIDTKDWKVVRFSKKANISFSTKALSKKVDRNDLWIFYFDENKQKYVLIDDETVINLEDGIISTNIEYSGLYIIFPRLDWSSTRSEGVNSSSFSFRDIVDHWAKGSINILLSMWVLKNKTKYYPDNFIKRTELVKIAMEVFKHWKAGQVNDIVFTDVWSDQWYTPYLVKAYEIWIISWDWVNKNFRPWENVNRAEWLKVLFEAAWIDAKKIWMNQNKFTDVAEDAWYYDYINYAFENWIISWYWDWVIEPVSYLTRAQMAVLATRVKEFKERIAKAETELWNSL